MKEYIVHFDFTTVHGKGRFVGRNGQVGIQSDNTLEQVNADREEITKLCVAYIHHEKPKWNIFMITIKDISEVNLKK